MPTARDLDNPDQNLFTLNINWDGFKNEVEKLIERSFAAKKSELREQIKQELLNELRGDSGSPDELNSLFSEDLSSSSNGAPSINGPPQIIEVLKIDGRANHTSYFVKWSNGETSWVQSGEIIVPHNLRRRYWNKCRIEREKMARHSTA